MRTVCAAHQTAPGRTLTLLPGIGFAPGDVRAVSRYGWLHVHPSARLFNGAASPVSALARGRVLVALGRPGAGTAVARRALGLGRCFPCLPVAAGCSLLCRLLGYRLLSCGPPGYRLLGYRLLSRRLLSCGPPGEGPVG